MKAEASAAAPRRCDVQRRSCDCSGCRRDPHLHPLQPRPGSIDVSVPDMGSFDSVGVIDVLVKAGDSVDFETPLVTLETDKATMDVPSTAKGVVEKVHVSKGGKVSPGSVVVTVKGHAAAAAAPAKAAPPLQRLTSPQPAQRRPRRRRRAAGHGAGGPRWFAADR